jgi:hypothetical protein
VSGVCGIFKVERMVVRCVREYYLDIMIYKIDFYR